MQTDVLEPYVVTQYALLLVRVQDQYGGNCVAVYVTGSEFKTRLTVLLSFVVFRMHYTQIPRQ